RNDNASERNVVASDAHWELPSKLLLQPLRLDSDYAKAFFDTELLVTNATEIGYLVYRSQCSYPLSGSPWLERNYILPRRTPDILLSGGRPWFRPNRRLRVSVAFCVVQSLDDMINIQVRVPEQHLQCLMSGDPLNFHHT